MDLLLRTISKLFNKYFFTLILYLFVPIICCCCCCHFGIFFPFFFSALIWIEAYKCGKRSEKKILSRQAIQIITSWKIQLSMLHLLLYIVENLIKFWEFFLLPFFLTLPHFVSGLKGKKEFLAHQITTNAVNTPKIHSMNSKWTVHCCFLIHSNRSFYILQIKSIKINWAEKSYSNHSVRVKESANRVQYSFRFASI